MASKAYGTVPTIEGEEAANAGTIVRMKQGHSCCGGCCDMRRAVIIVDMLMICFLILDIIGMTGMSNMDEVEDEQYEERETSYGGLIFIFLIEVVCFSIGVWGGVTLSWVHVAVALTLYVITIVLNLIVFNAAAIFLACCFAYPHVFLIREIKKGIMTKDNYYNENQSCCCVQTLIFL
jgi:hypothetical protein